MRATHIGFLLFQFAAVAHGQCPCTTTAEPSNTTAMATGNATAATTVVAATTAAPARGNGTTPMPTRTEAPAAGAREDPAPSDGPGASSGPGRLLMEEYEVEFFDRQLQDDNSSDDTAGNSSDAEVATTAATTTVAASAADSCACPAPQAVSSFTTILSGLAVDDLANLDVDAFKQTLTGSSNWGDDPDVEVVAVVKIGLQYTLDVEITADQCVAAIAAAYSVPEAHVVCGAGTAAAASDSSDSNATATTTAASRRLQEVMDVTISFTDATAASDAATASSDTAAFTDALAALPTPVTATATVSEPSVTVELTVTVTSDVAISEPSQATLQGAASAGGMASATIEVADFTFAYDRMPCSESDICSGNLILADAAETIGCSGATCTDAETDICCVTRPVVGNARRTCAAGSLLSLLMWNFF